MNKKQTLEINYWKFILTGAIAIILIPILEVFQLQYKFTEWLLK